MVLAHNMEALSALRYSINTSNKLRKSSERLSTGYKINRSADNAAGLQISEKMRGQIRGLEAASSNAQDGISFIQTADGALGDVQALIQRGRELCVQAANDTNVDNDREAIQSEIDAINTEINRIAEQTEFNTLRCFPTGGATPSKLAPINKTSYSITIDRDSDTVIVEGSSSDSGSTLANKIATELIPNALTQILNAFPALDTMDRNIDLKLEVTNIDGSSGTLAYAQISFIPTTGDILTYTLRVDSSDFTDEDADGTGSRAEMLESTIAHEMMHHVMYNALRDGMTSYGPEDYPDWFVEGAAQVAGGGFTTGWNTTLTGIENGSLSNDDKNTAVSNYLQAHTLNGRPYGHGYLATMYLGYLASGSGAVTASSICNGLNKIFDSLRNGNTLDQAIAANTPFANATALQNVFSSPTNELVAFVRSLAAANGAGSAIAPSLSTKGTDILENSTTGLKTMFVVTDVPDVTPPGGGSTPVNLNQISLQIGANSNQSLQFQLYDISTGILGLDTVTVIDHLSASNGIHAYDEALNRISGVRSAYGAVQNRLEHAIANAENTAENLQAAETRIRDVDMAKEMVEYSISNILLQAGQAMMTQANQSRQGILSLLQ